MNPETDTRIVVICGPTASGKSHLALRMAHETGAEIVNADSMQIYRNMDIGTAKPSAAERDEIRHHVIDIADPDQPFSAADYSDAADAAIADIIRRGKRAVVVGGTGLYIRSLLKGLVDSPCGDASIRRALHEEADRIGNGAMLERLRSVDPDLAAGMHQNNLLRIIRALEVFELTGIPLSRHQKEHAFSTVKYTSLQIGVAVDRPLLYRRIDARVDQMMDCGLMDEVDRLLRAGYGRELKAMRSIGYKEAGAFLCGEISYDEANRLIKRNTRHYAKRQLTWFRADPDILWFEYPREFDTIKQYVIDFFEKREV